MGARGYTLFELLIVMAVLGVAVSLAVPRFSTALGGVRLEMVAEELAIELRRTRNRAISQGREVAFRLDFDERSYGPVDGAMLRQLPAEVGLALQDHLGGTNRQGSGQILFFPDGSATGGRILIGKETDFLTLHVDWLTGRVHLLESS